MAPSASVAPVVSLTGSLQQLWLAAQGRWAQEAGCIWCPPLSCSQSYTTYGLELTRVTVVDTDMQVVYDTFVKPDNEVVDYNTRCVPAYRGTPASLPSCPARRPSCIRLSAGSQG